MFFEERRLLFDESASSSDDGTHNNVTLFTDEQVRRAGIAVMVSSSLSIVGTLLIIISFLVFESTRKNHNLKLVFWLSVATFLASASSFTAAPWVGINEATATAGCIVQGVGIQTFSLSIFLWSFCIAFNIYRTVTLSFSLQEGLQYSTV
eukprot:TRINITY_DN5593_c0_g1_i1.p1 TRINITY_DN5593_c0_g1~~TRINITY_DN5593_c0_g1_i1.p1  ORF type:complete len:150 (+),score=28.18 TRINITY_DN5593_c0_g1_i1:128-577(+)